MNPPTTDQLEVASCREADDQIPGRSQMTAFRRAARYHQSCWREANQHPIGTQPIVPTPGKPVRHVGSRLPLDYARESGANFLTAAALGAARTRVAYVEPHQTFDHQRLWADLLSSPALSFNLFGELAADLRLADRFVRRWCPDAPGGVTDVRFAHSPGRLDRTYLNSLRSFATALYLDDGSAGRGIIAIDVKYHERNKSEVPRPENLDRYTEVAERSGAFAPGAIDALLRRSDLCVMWLEHLLMLSMLQLDQGRCTWGKYIAVHTAANPDAVDLCARYRGMLADDATFDTITLEQILDAGTLPRSTVAALRARYVV